MKIKMRKAKGELTVRRVTEAPERLEGFYDAIVVPVGHFIVCDEAGTEWAYPPAMFAVMFELDEKDPDGEFTVPDEPDATVTVPTISGEATVGVGGDKVQPEPKPFPSADVPVDVPAPEKPAPKTPIVETPVPGNASLAGDPPAPSQPATDTPATPSGDDIKKWVDDHYAPRYRLRLYTKLNANPVRAAELIAKHPVGGDDAPKAEVVLDEPKADEV